MGSRNEDRIPLSARRSRCETVAQMLAGRWEVTAKCQTCRVELKVDLRTIALVRGPGFSLWNKLARCRSVACTRGRVEFRAKAPGMAYFEPLATPPPAEGPPPNPAWLRGRDGPG